MILARPWADRVFHVLAHVQETAVLAPSVHDEAYVAFVERHAGPARERALFEDAHVLGRTLTSHAALADAQLLAWLFTSDERADACAARDLVELTDDDVDRPALLPRLRAVGPAVEVLRCAAHLEKEAHARLPAASLDHEAVRAAVDDLAGAAPELARFELACVRSLRLRGRVLGGEIWVGAPGPEPWPSIEHVAWQAAHEATVAELQRELPDAGFEALERAALQRLEERAGGTHREAPHRRWRDHLAVSWRTERSRT
jgi:hypothetical protein